MDINRLNAYKVGIKEIDDNHLEYCKLIESLYISTDNDIIEKLRILEVNLIQHFIIEELYMESIMYPYVKDHVFEHKRILNSFEKIAQLIKSYRSDYCVSQLFEELLKHIDNFDMQISKNTK